MARPTGWIILGDMKESNGDNIRAQKDVYWYLLLPFFFFQSKRDSSSMLTACFQICFPPISMSITILVSTDSISMKKRNVTHIEGPERWPCGRRHLPLRLATWVQSRGPTRWKERTDFLKLSSDPSIRAEAWKNSCRTFYLHCGVDGHTHTT